MLVAFFAKFTELSSPFFNCFQSFELRNSSRLFLKRSSLSPSLDWFMFASTMSLLAINYYINKLALPTRCPGRIVGYRSESGVLSQKFRAQAEPLSSLGAWSGNFSWREAMRLDAVCRDFWAQQRALLPFALRERRLSSWLSSRLRLLITLPAWLIILTICLTRTHVSALFTSEPGLIKWKNCYI